MEGFVLIDPDPYVGDRAYDLGVALRDWCADLTGTDRPGALSRRWCRAVAAQSGADAEAVWGWACLERVSTGLYACSLGAEELGRPLLDTAAMILAERS